MPTRKTVISAIIVAAMAVTSLSSCRTPKNITYFQDMHEGTQVSTTQPVDVVARPGDRISIVVHSKDPQLAALFNLPIVSNRVGTVGSSASTSGSGQTSSYMVDPYGDIDFPVLGTLNVNGMKRTEISDFIKKELIQRNLVKDPTVIVDFLNHSVTVLGEVHSPGKVSFDRDRYTIIDAIAGAGDLSIQGCRENVIVLRQEDGKQVAHTVDLTDAKSLVNSPVYYLRQDDIIYVEPTDVQKRSTTANGNSIFTLVLDCNRIVRHIGASAHKELVIPVLQHNFSSLSIFPKSCKITKTNQRRPKPA